MSFSSAIWVIQTILVAHGWLSNLSGSSVTKFLCSE